MLSIVSTLTNYIIFICFFTTQSKIYSLRHLSIARVSKTQAIGSSCRAFVRMTTTSSTTVISSKDSFPIDTVLDKPAIDPRDYLQFILPNEIVVTVVSDVTSEKSSAALAVDVGASADTLAGLAHMTEHAVFLGSEKYPIENAYKDYLNKNGGSSNGGTSMEKTTYKFQVNAKAFPHALDIFSQFFKKPLFDTDAISREVMAVDAEDSKNRIIDGRRTLQVLKDQIVPTSPYAKFSTGNVKTLAKNDPNQFGNELAEEIRRFHSTYYRPENMALSLVGPQSVEELKKLAEEMFGDIKSTEYEEIKSDTNNDVKFGLFKDGGAKMLRIKPVKDIRDMSIIWEVPPTRNFYRNSPTRLLGHLLGHKGEGSIFALLQDKGWATGVSAGIRTTYVDFSLFEVSVSLTPEGEKHIPEIESIIYSYINLIFGSSLKTMSNIWSEICSINSLEFQYQERSTPYELAPYLASTMLDYPLNHVLSAGWLLDNDFPTDLMINFLNKLKRDKSMIIIRSKSFAWLPDDDRDLTAIVKKVEEVQNQKKHILIEPHYGVPYDFSPLEEIGTDSQEYNSVLQLPKPNTYISTELIGKEMDTSRSEKLRSSPPQLIYNGQIPGKVPVDVWHSTDEVFKQPRSVLTMLMYTKETGEYYLYTT